VCAAGDCARQDRAATRPKVPFLPRPEARRHGCGQAVELGTAAPLAVTLIDEQQVVDIESRMSVYRVLAGRDPDRGSHADVFDPQTRELLRTRLNPLTWDQARRLRGARPAGPAQPSTAPVTVQRRASNTGVIMLGGLKIALGTDSSRPRGDRSRCRGRPHHCARKVP